MKFMVTWRIHEDKRVEVLQNWASLTPEQRRITRSAGTEAPRDACGRKRLLTHGILPTTPPSRRPHGRQWRIGDS